MTFSHKQSIGLSLIAVVSVILLGIIGPGCSGTGNKTLPITTTSSEALQDFLTGRELVSNLRNSEATRYFESAVRKDRGFALAYYYLGISSPTAKGFFENIREAQKHINSVSEGERTLIEAGLAGVNGELDRQQQLLTKLSELYPSDPQVRMFLANFYFQLQKYDSAAIEYQAVVAIDSNFAPPYNMLGYTYRSLEEYERAAEAFQKYIALIPGDPNPYDSYAELQMRLGKCEEAIEYYRKALALAPTFAPSRLGIASCLIFLNRHEEAREELSRLYDSAIDASQQSGALFAMAISYADEGRFDDAIGSLRKQFALDSTQNDAAAMANDMQNMALLQVWTKRPEAARASLDRAIALIDASDLFDRVKANAHLDDSLGRARIMMVEGNLDGARSLARKYLEAVEARGFTFRVRNAHAALGFIELYAGNYQAALDNLEQANSQVSWILYHIGLAYEGLGDTARALDYYDQVATAYERNSLTYALVRNLAVNKIAELTPETQS